LADQAALDLPLRESLAAIAAGAERLDREPRFPAEAILAEERRAAARVAECWDRPEVPLGLAS
jgi:hypothetical protein